VLNIIVEGAARRQIPPTFPEPTVMFVNLIGLAETADHALSGEENALVSAFSHIFALINAAVEARGGVLKNVTYHLTGSDILIYFGAPNAHTDDPIRAADAALAIRDILTGFPSPVIGGTRTAISCQIGMARGPVFAAEIGEPRGRREFNILGDTVNTAARVMSRATGNRILMTAEVYQEIAGRFMCESLGTMSFKGKSAPVPIYALTGHTQEN
jgi:class 3 adenylate cyclase